MGTVNFMTSEYLTLSLEPFNSDLYLEDGEVNYNLMQIDYDEVHEEVNAEIEKYDFEFFDVSIEYGYYESFSLMIENLFPELFDDWTEKQDAIKEVNNSLKPLLTACAGLGLVNTFPGWCTGYEDKENTLKAIDAAASQMIREIATIPVYEAPEPEKTEKVA